MDIWCQVVPLNMTSADSPDEGDAGSGAARQPGRELGQLAVGPADRASQRRQAKLQQRAISVSRQNP